MAKNLRHFRGKIHGFTDPWGQIKFGPRHLHVVSFHRSEVRNFHPNYFRAGLSVDFGLPWSKVGNQRFPLDIGSDLFAEDIRVNYNQASINERFVKTNVYALEMLEQIELIESEEEALTTPQARSREADTGDENSRETAIDRSARIALAFLGNRIKLVSLTPDGEFRFLDEGRRSHSILYQSSLEEVILQVAIEELEDLINSRNVSENDLQKFFERNPNFLLSEEYRAAHPHVVLSNEENELIPDFVLEPVQQRSFCDLLELKLPKETIYVLKKNRPRFSAKVLEAVAQLRTYSYFFNEEKNRLKFESRYPDLRIFRPKMYVVIGRHEPGQELLQQQVSAEIPELRLLNYEQLVDRMKRKTEELSRRNMMFRDLRK